MNYCSNCAETVSLRVPEDDNRERYVCDGCGHIHYQNPNIVAGCIVETGSAQDRQLLLCRRAIEPRVGYWTMPAGFMENGETVAEAAARETMEEAGAAVEVYTLMGVYSVPHISQVHMMFRGTLLNEDFAPGIESLETTLFKLDDIPWDELAFKVTTLALKHYVEDPTAIETRIDQIVV